MKKIIVCIVIIGLCILIFFGLFKTKETKHTKNNSIKTETKKKKQEIDEKRMSLVAVGDCLIHGALYMDAKTGKDTYDFSNMISDIKPLINDYDLKFFNQESIIGGKNLGISHYPRFNSPDEIGDAITDIGFNRVSLANNHSLDKGEEGIIYSTKYWKNKDVIASGTNLSNDDRNNIITYETNGIKYSFMAYTTVTNGLSTPDGKEYLLNVYDKDKVKEDIDKIKDKVDVIIISMHWGEEYTHTPVKEERDIASYLASLGVDLIIGTHPHVIQPIEYIDDTLVIYSLGNFISGQKPMGIDKIIGLMVGMDIVVKDKVTFENINNTLLYTYSTSDDRNYKVIPFSNLNEDILTNYKQLEKDYLNIVNSPK